MTFRRGRIRRRRRVPKRFGRRRARRSIRRTRFVSLTPMLARRILRYHDNFQLITTDSPPTPSGHVFNANSLFDPDLTGTGHQPMGYDDVTTRFAHYYVEKVHVTAIWMGDSTEVAAAPGMVSCCIQHREVSSVSASWNQVVEHKVSTKLGFFMGSPGGGGKNTTTLRMMCYPSRRLGILNGRSNSSLNSVVSANPTQRSFIHLLTQSQFGLSTRSTNYTLDVTLVFYAYLLRSDTPPLS